jgi:hypothetical protein
LILIAKVEVKPHQPLTAAVSVGQVAAAVLIVCGAKCWGDTAGQVVEVVEQFPRHLTPMAGRVVLEVVAAAGQALAFGAVVMGALAAAAVLVPTKAATAAAPSF